MLSTRSLIDMSEPHPILRASLAGRYNIERELGEGGMAAVYAAHDVWHGTGIGRVIRRMPARASTLVMVSAWNGSL
jgi:hypothetical protein